MKTAEKKVEIRGDRGSKRTGLSYMQFLQILVRVRIHNDFVLIAAPEGNVCFLSEAKLKELKNQAVEEERERIESKYLKLFQESMESAFELGYSQKNVEELTQAFETLKLNLLKAEDGKAEAN